MPIRTFIALELPPELRETLLTSLNKWQKAYPDGINWVRPENLHLTLLFLGDTPEDRIPELKDCLNSLAKEQRAFELSANGFELFPPKQIRMIWAQLTAPNREIQKFNRRLLFETLNLHLEPDPKELRLHITMGRIKRSQSPVFEREILSEPFSSPLSRFDTLSLYQSILRPEGPQYSLLEQLQLT
ncbi:MAG TPA: RNA 2',3'-cyclic phosphodiesterase [Candidatus Cloacimonadota bacterium]|nr:RNA 2',3'-cyclic phosphodiesterase [Candidatus Cloacimonadota bacterium]